MKAGMRCLLVIGFLSIGIVACTPACDGTFVKPENVSPPNMSITDSVRPVLTWTYPEGYCDPQEFMINFFTNSTNGTISPAGFGGPTGSADRSWTPGFDLTPGTAYLWSVASKNGTMIGPYSNEWQFYVGPECDPTSLVAPVRVEPAEGETVNTLTPRMEWSYPDGSCMPEGYHLISYDAADLSSWFIDADNPTQPNMSFQAGYPYDDCATYYWHVAAVSDGVEGPFSDVGTFTVEAGTCLCEPSDFVEPILVWPGPYEIVPDLQPVLEWSWPGDCEVGGYGIHLSTDKDFEDTSLNGGTGNPNTAWTAGVPLEPAMQYWWRVFAGVGTDFGPYSSRRAFFTGPECANLGELDAPEQLYPANGETVDTLTPWLHWRAGDPGCIPDGYFVDLQTDPTFGGTNLLGEYGLPATNLMPDPLDDCTTYYWRVAGMQGGSYGPYSDTRWFRTNESGTCMFPYYPGFVLENVNCRIRGDRVCPVRYIFEPGMVAEVLGRSVDGAYLKLRNPNGGECYSPTFAFDVPLEELEMVRLPPTPIPVPPTPTPIACNINLNQSQCKAAGGTWMDISVRTPYCSCP